MKNINPTLLTCLLTGLLLLIVALFPIATEPVVFIGCLAVISFCTYYGGFEQGVLSTLLITIMTYFIYAIYLLPVYEMLARYVAFLTSSFFVMFVQVRLKVLSSIRERTNAEKIAIIDSTEDAVISKDFNGVVKTWNKGAENIFGYTEAEMVGQNIRKLLPTELNFEEDNIIKTIKSGQKISHYETKRMRKDGKIIDVSLTVSPITLKDGSIVGISKIARDITFRKKLEFELLNSEERYRDFVKNSNEGIWRFELREPCPTSLPIEEQIDWIYKYGYFAEVNDALAKLYGYPDRTFIIGQKLDFLLPKVLISKLFLSVFIKKNYHVENVESTEKNSEGKPIYFLNSLTGIVKDGFLYRGWGIQRDITASKRYAMEREELLQQAKTAKAIAEIANQEKDRFLANLSHELRTPLVSVLGYSSMLKDSNSISDMRNGLEIINKNAKIQLELIEDLLDISKIVAGKIVLNKSVFNLKEVVSEIVEGQQPRLINKGLTVSYTKDDLFLCADMRRISQAVSNLLINAIKFTEKGSIDINYKIENGNVVLSVKDTGIGIEKSNIKKLFKPFSQIDKSSTRTRGGIGLGLSIVKNLIELHNGTVGVNSELGKGSEFTVKFPYIEGFEEDTEDDTDISKTFSGLNILVVEDDEYAGEFLKTYLTKNDANVILTTSVKEALEIVAQQNFDIYLCDIAMPDEDGISFIRKIRALGDKTPAVAISAYVNYEDLALGNGFDLFLAKPIDIDKLYKVKVLLK